MLRRLLWPDSKSVSSISSSSMYKRQGEVLFGPSYAFCLSRAVGSTGSWPPGPPRSSFSPLPFAAVHRVCWMVVNRGACLRYAVEKLGRALEEIVLRARMEDILSGSWWSCDGRKERSRCWLWTFCHELCFNSRISGL